MFDLKRGLTGLGSAPRIDGDPVDVGLVTDRVRRRRAARSAGVAAASAAAVVGVAAVAWAVGPWSDPHLPADPSPTIEPAPTTPEPTTEPLPEETVEPLPEETPDTTQAPEADLPPIVGLTQAGELVLVDPDTGATLDVVATGLERSGLSVDRPGRAVYLNQDTGDWPGDVIRVSLDGGAVTAVAKGYDPAISPDGSTLVYTAWVPGPDSLLTKGPRLLDVASGREIAYVPDGVCGECDWGPEAPTWSPDGSRLLIPRGGRDGGPGGFSLAVVDVDDPPATLEDAEAIRPPGTDENGDRPDDPRTSAGYEDARFLADGTVAVVGYDARQSEDLFSWEFDYYLTWLVDGEPQDRVDLPDLTDFTLGTAGEAVVINGYRRSGETITDATTWLWSPGEPLTELQVETPLVSVAW